MSITNPDDTSNAWGLRSASVSTNEDAPSNPSILAAARVKPTHVPDDWDDDDDDDEEGADNQKIWETANSKSPMPQLVISRPSTSATVISPPPPTIIQAPMRILKRPTPTTTPSNDSSASPSPVPQTLAEREAKYQEARERIFGSPKLSGQDGPTIKTPQPKPVPDIVRNPAGPDTDASGRDPNASQGFSSKRGRRPPKP